MHAPVTTFERNGKQYVLAFSAGAALLGSARGDSVWLFSLDGTLPPVQPGTPASRQVVAAAPTGQPNLASGKQVYDQACVVCHEADGKGGHGAAASLVALKDIAATMQTVAGGRNSMPAFSANFTPEQIRDVSAYVIRVLADSESSKLKVESGK